MTRGYHQPSMRIDAKHLFSRNVADESSLVLRVSRLGAGHGFTGRVRDEDLPTRYADALAAVLGVDLGSLAPIPR